LHNHHFNSARSWVLAWVSTLASLSIAQLPYEITVLSNAYQFGATVAGAVASLEIFSLAITIVWVSRRIAYLDKRRVCLIGICVALLGGVLTLILTNIAIFFVARALFGIGLGLVAVSCNALPALHPKPERIYAYMQIALSFVFVALMYAQTPVENLVGKIGMFVIQDALLLLLLPLALFLPRGLDLSSDLTRAESRHAPLPRRTVYLLFSSFIVCIAMGAAWAFAEQAGHQLHLSSERIELYFSLSAILMLLGPVVAAALGVRVGSRYPLAFGLLSLAASVIGIYSGGISPYMYGVLSINALNAFIVPYYLGALAEYDETGRSAALGFSANLFGFSIAPVLAGLLYSAGGLATLTIVSISLFAGAAATGVPFMPGRRRPVERTMGNGINLHAPGIGK